MKPELDKFGPFPWKLNDVDNNNDNINLINLMKYIKNYSVMEKNMFIIQTGQTMWKECT